MRAGPVDKNRVEAALANTGFTEGDLIRVTLLRKEAQRYFIGFNYFTAQDMRRVHAVATARVPTLVAAYRDRQEGFNRAFDNYPVQSVPRDKLAFAVIAGISLNCDGLKITRQEGFRKLRMARGDGWQYGFWATEVVPEYSKKAFYWGSSTLPAGEHNYPENPVDFAFSSFGDGHSYPRMNFPALLYVPASDLAPKVRELAVSLGFIHETSIGLDLHDVLGLELGRDAGKIFFDLRARPRTLAELGKTIGDEKRAGLLLALFEETQLVEQDTLGLYYLLIPVLDHLDREMLDAALALSREILVRWLRANYAEMRRELSDLTAMRHGVPFESLFTQIWHEFFGLTTREIARAGFIADAYAEDVRHKGSFSLVWRHALYDFDPQ